MHKTKATATTGNRSSAKTFTARVNWREPIYAANHLHHQLQRRDVRSLQTLRALLGFEANLLVFGERLEAVATNFRKVGEEVVAACVRRNKAEALAVVEPLDDTGIHDKSLKI
jgi:hypothetical protein